MMLPHYVTKDGKCVYCSARLIRCKHPQCNTYFAAKNKRHIFCRPRCKMRNWRKKQ